MEKLAKYGFTFKNIKTGEIKGPVININTFEEFQEYEQVEATATDQSPVAKILGGKRNE